MTNSNRILPVVADALKTFVYADEVKEILSLALASIEAGKPINLLFYGPGGHGKSEIVRALFKALQQSKGQNFGIQSFGEGMTEAKMYGGINMKALNCTENPRLEFQPDNCFLNCANYLFEELFDAPPSVLLALKDTLTSRCLNNGHQSYEMKTLMLIAATNRNPAEIADMGASYQALVERFPWQINVAWPSYNQEAFYNLFLTADNNSSTISISNDLKKVLAGLIADAHSKGQWISPRQAMVCLSSLRASATIQERKEANEDDLWAIKFISGTDGILDDLAAKLERVTVIREATAQLDKARKEVNEISQKMTDYNGNSKIPSSQKGTMLLNLSAKLDNINEKVSNIRVPDQLTEQRNNLQNEVIELSDKALKSAKGYVK